MGGRLGAAQNNLLVGSSALWTWTSVLLLLLLPAHSASCTFAPSPGWRNTPAAKAARQLPPHEANGLSTCTTPNMPGGGSLSPGKDPGGNNIMATNSPSALLTLRNFSGDNPCRPCKARAPSETGTLHAATPTSLHGVPAKMMPTTFMCTWTRGPQLPRAGCCTKVLAFLTPPPEDASRELSRGPSGAATPSSRALCGARQKTPCKHAQRCIVNSNRRMQSWCNICRYVGAPAN